jgi:DNA-binding transcriptional ArsR family regulator
MSYQLVLTALSDPTRREILERLRVEERAVGELAAALPVSRPAVSKHLAVLEAAGLVRHVRSGTRSLYSIDARGLEELRSYLDQFWTDVLVAFADRAESEARHSAASAPKAREHR